MWGDVASALMWTAGGWCLYAGWGRAKVRLRHLIPFKVITDPPEVLAAASIAMRMQIARLEAEVQRKNDALDRMAARVERLTAEISRGAKSQNQSSISPNDPRGSQ